MEHARRSLQWLKATTIRWCVHNWSYLPVEKIQGAASSNLLAGTAKIWTLSFTTISRWAPCSLDNFHWFLRRSIPRPQQVDQRRQFQAARICSWRGASDLSDEANTAIYTDIRISTYIYIYIYIYTYIYIYILVRVDCFGLAWSYKDLFLDVNLFWICGHGGMMWYGCCQTQLLASATSHASCYKPPIFWFRGKCRLEPAVLAQNLALAGRLSLRSPKMEIEWRREVFCHCWRW